MGSGLWLQGGCPHIGRQTSDDKSNVQKYHYEESASDRSDLLSVQYAGGDTFRVVQAVSVMQLLKRMSLLVSPNNAPPFRLIFSGGCWLGTNGSKHHFPLCIVNVSAFGSPGVFPWCFIQRYCHDEYYQIICKQWRKAMVLLRLLIDALELSFNSQCISRPIFERASSRDSYQNCINSWPVYLQELRTSRKGAVKKATAHTKSIKASRQPPNPPDLSDHQ